ncbi:MAG TPA: P1 family peptidase [Bryobacteraceae bacterium]|nr:P1 family peptidase [Bryobacteraceae bacterium]
MKGLTDIPGIRVGHASDAEALTGVTAILCEGGAVAGVDIGGGATGSQELDVLSPLHVTPAVHAVTLAGGSAFGLEAASGVRRFLEKKGIGFPFGVARIPIVPAMILFDLGIGRSDVRPTREMGEAAASAANTAIVVEGSVGAGTGATVGKLYGMARAMKGGIGTFTVPVGSKGLLVSALAAVNAFGDVRDPAGAKLIAGCRASAESRELIGTEREMLATGRRGPAAGGNTTLCVVATNAKLSKVSATRLAKMAQAGVLRTLSPGHTTVDGDIVIALSTGEAEADLNVLGVAAAEAVAQAIVRGVKYAKGAGGVPGLG